MKVDSTIAKYIQRFREDKPLPRERRWRHSEDTAGAFWWTRIRADSSAIPHSTMGRKSVPKDHHPNSTPVGQEISHLQPQEGKGRGISHAQLSSTRTELDHRYTPVTQATPLNPPLGRPMFDGQEKQTFKGKETALQVQVVRDADDGKGEDNANQSIFEVGVGPETVRHEHIRECGRDSDKFVDLDARAHTLLDECRELLAPSSTAARQVLFPGQNLIGNECSVLPAEDNFGLHGNSPSPGGIEERARILLNSREQPPVGNNTRAVGISDRFHLPESWSRTLPSSLAEISTDDGQEEVQSSLFGGRVSEGRGPSNRWLCAEQLNETENEEQCYGHQATSARNIESASLTLATEDFGRPAISDGVCGEYDCTSLRSTELDYSYAQGGMSRYAEDPVLRSLLHRLGEIEAELKRRHSYAVLAQSGR